MGNEFSYYMLLASAYVLNCTERPGQWVVHLLLAAAYADAGELDKAAAERRTVDRIAPGYTIERLRAYRYSENPDYLRLVEAQWYAGLRKAGVPER